MEAAERCINNVGTCNKESAVLPGGHGRTPRHFRTRRQHADTTLLAIAGHTTAWNEGIEGRRTAVDVKDCLCLR